ncbi:hypothetical protein HAX54_045466, partial [Datura stramonium]|nr:hypothetical protein [Datura stramonium]
TTDAADISPRRRDCDSDSTCTAAETERQNGRLKAEVRLGVAVIQQQLLHSFVDEVVYFL